MSMPIKNLSEWATAVVVWLENDKLEPTPINIDTVMMAKDVPLAFRSKLPELVKGMYQKNDPKFYAQFVNKEKNDQITNCSITDDVSDTYYSSYKNFLNDENKFKVERLLNANSLGIINQIPDPTKSKANKYSIKGLVVGQIQSGKTANIEALVCRAVDFGYRFIIVLCGRTNALRLQTQQRFDNEITNTEYSTSWSSLTNIENLRIELGSVSIDTNPLMPKLAIIKKIKPSLEKIIESIQDKHDQLKEHPVLIIDDECDDASIDTNANKEDTDPTRTNQKIRDLIQMFDKSVYVGFSATPFANVFINAYNEEDLYPKDFIFLLDTPDGYTGTKSFIEQNRDNFKPIKEIDDEEVPIDTLKEAIYSFILSCCISTEKKLIPNENHTMLIHPSHLQDIHKKWKKAVDDIINVLNNFKDRPETFSRIKRDFEDIFKRDFSKDLSSEKFEDIFKHHRSIINKIEIIKLNSDREREDSDICLKYSEGYKVYIVIGGNILSRGLTLEGLMTSIFTREAKKPNYDTLMQMQRWCGFRKDYLKFTKIYTTDKLKNCLVDLIDIEEDFRTFLKEKYKEEECSPLAIQPQIKTHPSMRVTSNSKKGNSIEIAYNKFGDDIKILKFHSNSRELNDNLLVIKEWVKGKVFSKTKNKEYVCKINKEELSRLADNYTFYDQDLKRRVKQRIQYLDFNQWEVVIHNPETIKDSDFYDYTEEIKVSKVRRGLIKKGNSLTIQTLKHKFQPAHTDIPRLFIYTIDEKSNKVDYPRKSLKLDEHLEAPCPIVGLLFNFPKSKESFDTNNVRTQDT